LLTRTNLCAIALLAGFGLACDYTAAAAKGTCAAFAALDPDNDGTLDLDEANRAASAVFDRLDKDKEGTLSVKELQGRLSKKQVAAGDPDNDKTLTKEEYLVIVAGWFKAADVDNEGTLDCREAQSPTGRALMRLLK
jgi:Ca2+-binding EF-hand superfamily protein